MKKRWLTILIAGSLACSSFSFIPSTTSAAAQTNHSQMQQYVRNILAKSHVRGTTVVIKNGTPQQISYGYGWYGRKIGNGNKCLVYPTGSLQKVITAAIIVQLINETANTSQQFTQYTKISRWYPDLRNANKITVGNLLTHTSGITATGTEINRGYNYSENNAIKWVINNINATPERTIGTYFYNNSNYILLAGIIRKVTHQTYANNFQQRIINKLGLTHTYLYQNIPHQLTDPISYIYSRKHNYQRPAYVKSTLASQLPGAGNLFTTPMDYYKILVGLTNGDILSQNDFNYLTHLKAKATQYSGGVYLKNNDQLIMAYGNLAGTHFGNWFQITADGQNGLIMFLNQTNDNENTVKNVGYQILNHIKPNTFSNR